MSRYVTADEPYTLMGWAAARLGFTTVWPPESRPLAVVESDGTIHAVVVYNAFYDDACHMHIATAKTRRWATKATLETLFGYPFNKLGLRRVSAQIAASNVAAQVMALKLGFRFEGVMRNAINGQDAVLFGMLKEDCRFIHHKQEIDGQDASLQEKHEAQNGQEFVGTVA